MRAPEQIAAIAIELSEKKEEAAVVADGDFRRLLWEEAKFLREAAEALRETLKEAESWENQYNELLDTVGGVWPH
mgnify:CR=1 FL=1